jgi:hypothetical protein
MSYRVEVKYGTIVKAYTDRFDTMLEALTFAKSKRVYPSYTKASIIPVDKHRVMFYTVHIH